MGMAKERKVVMHKEPEVHAEIEPEWITAGRKFAEGMAEIKLARSQSEVEKALREYNIERKYNG